MSQKEQLAAVFTSVKIGKTRIKNRIVFPPMCTYYSDDNGSITPRIKEFVRARAAGGVGLFILPGTPYGIPSRARPAISEDDHIQGWRELKEIASAYGMSLFCQLHPSRLQMDLEASRPPEKYGIKDIHKPAP